jgi:hypothetical protein
MNPRTRLGHATELSIAHPAKNITKNGKDSDQEGKALQGLHREGPRPPIASRRPAFGEAGRNLPLTCAKKTEGVLNFGKLLGVILTVRRQLFYS